MHSTDMSVIGYSSAGRKKDDNNIQNCAQVKQIFVVVVVGSYEFKILLFWIRLIFCLVGNKQVLKNCIDLHGMRDLSHI